MRFAIHCWISLNASGTLLHKLAKAYARWGDFPQRILSPIADSSPTAKVGPNPVLVVTRLFINLSNNICVFSNIEIYLMSELKMPNMPTKELTEIQVEIEVVDQRMTETAKWVKQNLVLVEEAFEKVKADQNNQEVLKMMSTSYAQIKMKSTILFLVYSFLKKNFKNDFVGGVFSNFIRTSESLQIYVGQMLDLYQQGAMGTKAPHLRAQYWQASLNAVNEMINLTTMWKKSLKAKVDKLALRKEGPIYHFKENL